MDETLAKDEGLVAQIVRAILEFISKIPETSEVESADPDERARGIGRSASRKAAVISGALALPPGPLGMATVLPDLIALWKLQAQLVADIAAVYGKSATLNQEQMMYCLFRHTAAQAVRDLVMRVGERILVRRASLRFMQSVARSVGLRITQRAIGQGISRWIPVVGALGVGGYSYYDTSKVADTAIELFKRDISVDGGPEL
jgi:hypothetical protein